MDNNQLPPHPSHHPHAPMIPPTMHDTSVMSTKDWIITYLIMMIPCVGIIMMFVWAFSSTGNLNRRNYSRAVLIILGVVIAIYIVFAILFGAAMFAMFL